jgi:hypothetical protein
MTASKPHDFGPPGSEGTREAPAEAGLSGLLRRGVKAAIARWAVRRRGEAEIWPRPQDEAPHAWEGRRHFAEDYTLAAVQPELALVARIEWLPDREAHRIWLTILTPTAVYALPGTGQALLRGGGDHWHALGLAFDCVEPLRTWTLRYRGRLEVRDPEGHRRGPPGEHVPVEELEVRVDLTFAAQLPAFVPGSDDDPDLVSRQVGAADWDARLLKQLRRDRLRSYVQTGDVHGALVLGSQLSTFGGAGLRVHSWGVRDWGASDAAMQAFVSVQGATAAAGPVRAWVHSAQFPWIHLAGGFVQRAAGLVPIRGLGVSPTRRPGRAPSHVGLHIDAPGGALELEAESLAEHSLDMDGRGRLEFSLCRVRALATTDQVGAAGWGLLIGQRRVIPRSGAALP